MASPVKQSSTQLALKFYMVDSTDHVSAKTGLTPTVTIRKEGGSFASPAGTVTEIANGWYQVAGNATDTNTLGEIVLHATATGADPFDGVVACVVAYDPQSALATPTNITGGTITTVTNLTNLPSIPNNWLTAAGIAASALNGKGDWNVGKTGYSLTQTFPTNFSALAITAGGAVTAGTVSDKTGYALTQTFPTNFSALSIDSSGNVATTSNVKKNTAKNGFMFVMTDSTTHAPKTGLTVTATRSIDGGTYASCTNAVTEVATGTYAINLSAADTNGDHVMLRFTATGADDLNIEIVTQP